MVIEIVSEQDDPQPQAKALYWFACGCRRDVQQWATSIVLPGQTWPCQRHGEQVIVRVHAHLLKAPR